MRDLKADLELCNKATPGPWVKDERVGCVAVYPRSIGEINCMDESEGKRIFYKGGYQVLDEDGRFKHWEVHPQDIADAEFVAQARAGWPHAIERALEAEKRVEELENQVDILSTTLNMYCSPYYDMWERAEKAEALARELVAALRRISEILDNATCRCRCGFCEYFNAQKRAEKSLAKAKEVLGDGN